MLAQNFMSAEALELTDKQHAGLIKVLGMLERDELIHDPDLTRKASNGFCMDYWRTPSHHRDCGTVMCIGGWAETIGGSHFFSITAAQERLFYPLIERDLPPNVTSALYRTTTTQQAATALRNFLTTGEANWAEVLRA